MTFPSTGPAEDLPSGCASLWDMRRLISLRGAGLAALLGLAIVVATWVGTYRETHPTIGLDLLSHPMPTTYTTSPGWTTPVAAAIGIAAVATVALVLGRR
jgi:hypothetical protein